MAAKKKKAWTSRQFETLIAIIIVLAILVTSILFHYKFYLLNFFSLPVIFSGYYLGKKRAILIAITCILLETFYLVFSRQVFEVQFQLGYDELVLLISWAIFLFLTAWIVGILSEKKQIEVSNLRKAYIGILAIVLKYMEVGEEGKSRAEKVSELAGKIAAALEMSKAEIENIKSAALLGDIQELQTCLPLFSQTTEFIEKESFAQQTLSDREKITLKTTGLLLSEVQPILQSYFVHYRQKAGELEKPLNAIPLGASIIALSELYIKLSLIGKVKVGPEEIVTLEDINKLKGKYFPEKVVEALYLVVY